jgi:biotin carboxyl carrier protein
VTAFPFTSFYQSLNQIVSHFVPSGGPFGKGGFETDPSRLAFDSQGILNEVQNSTLASLRAEPTKAVLDKAVNARQNAYFAKYANKGAIIAKMNEYYSAVDPSINPNTKLNRLAILAWLAQQQNDALNDAYTEDQRLGVQKTTSSSVTEQGAHAEETVSANDDTDVSIALPSLPQAGQVWPGLISTPGSTGTYQEGSSGYAQTITNTDYGYRVPNIENQAQNQRAQISLMDQQFAAFMYSQNLPYLDKVFQNEKQSIDLDVKRLQVAYLNTILLSPIDGIVTGIYKNPGDAVRAGEPVVRVENNKTVILVAALKYPGRISIGQTATVQTNLFDSSTPTPPVPGRVIAVRGHRYEDDQWEVLVSCDNIDGFPLGYNFDYDDTVVTIS